jgi:hypothetical protein
LIVDDGSVDGTAAYVLSMDKRAEDSNSLYLSK